MSTLEKTIYALIWLGVVAVLPWIFAGLGKYMAWVYKVMS